MNRERRGEKMHLGGFFHPTGNHVAAWLHPGAQIDAGTNFAHYAEITRIAERGKFDLMFVADAVAVRDGKLNALKRWPQYMAYFDPLTLLPALAAVTSHIGLCATATTSYNEPYHIARKFASLDHISGGRAGWNVVTSSNVSEAWNFGREQHFEHGERYDRAVEFVEVVKGLWDSWEDDAFVRDRSTSVYFDPAKLHALNHKGPHFSVQGPLNVARPPQGHPVLFQAGSSDTGREVAARFAEGVFTPQHTLAGARDFYRDLKARMVRYDRPPEALKIMPGLNAIVGRTRKDAEETHRFLQSKIHPDVGLEVLSNQLGNFDLSEYDVDGPLPDIDESHWSLASQSSTRNIIRWAKEEKLTIRQIYERFAGARGQRTLIGSPVDIADDMETWFRGYGVDGFLVHPPYLPGGLSDFVDLVIPELQNRGLFRAEYEGATLRENMGLERPQSRYAV
jgi:alkanesulfonate monooxygenase